MIHRMLWLLLLVFFLIACESRQQYENEGVYINVGVQLDALAESQTTPFSPDDSNSFHLKSHFVVDDDSHASYLMWLYFAKLEVNQWQLFAVYEESVVAEFTLYFTTNGEVDWEASLAANGIEGDSYFRFTLQQGAEQVEVALDIEAITQYGLGSQVYYISRPEYVPHIHREKPTITTHFDLAMKVNDQAVLLDAANFNRDDSTTYNHAAVGVVYDSMGVQHWLYFFFLRHSSSEWWLYVVLKDSEERPPQDGWAERELGRGAYLLSFDGAGQLQRINGEDVGVNSALIDIGWRLESGATGTMGDYFSFQLGIHRIAQWSGDYLGEAEQDGGWYQ